MLNEDFPPNILKYTVKYLSVDISNRFSNWTKAWLKGIQLNEENNTLNLNRIYKGKDQDRGRPEYVGDVIHTSMEREPNELLCLLLIFPPLCRQCN